MTDSELIAICRMGMLAIGTVSVLYIGYRRARVDWLGVALLASSMTLAGAIGLLGIGRGMENVLRTPVTALAIAYVLIANLPRRT